MKRFYQTSIFLTLIFQTYALYSQGTLQGIIAYQNIGGKAASGVQVSAFRASAVYTTSSGMFEMNFASKKAGDKINSLLALHMLLTIGLK